MRGLWVTKYTDFNSLTIEELNRSPLKPNQLRILVKAAGVSFATNLVVSGKYQRRPPLPFTPGTECAGLVMEIGSGVKKFSPGDRVFAALDWGGYAEEAVSFEVNTYHLTDAISFAQATNFNSYATAKAALTWPRLLDVRSGDTLLVHGAAGALGLASIELGKILGAEVIATASNEDKLDVARAYGADHVINTSRDKFRDLVLEITCGRGVDKIIDPVGGHTFEQSLRCISFEGRICPIGFSSGIAAPALTNIILIKNISVVGLNFGTYYGWSPQDIRYESECLVRQIMNEFCVLSESGKIKPKVCEKYPLEMFREAMDHVISRRSIGRVVLSMNN